MIKLRGARYKSYAEKFVPPIILAKQYFTFFSTNLRTFLHNDFHMKAGMKCLIEEFYHTSLSVASSAFRAGRRWENLRLKVSCRSR